MIHKSIWIAIKRWKYHPKKARKLRQMQFHDKTAYVWGLRYRWDPSLSWNLIPAAVFFCLAWSIALILAAVLNVIVLIQNWLKSRNSVAKFTISHVEKRKVLNVRQRQLWNLRVPIVCEFKNMESWDWSTVLCSESERALQRIVQKWFGDQLTSHLIHMTKFCDQQRKN